MARPEKSGDRSLLSRIAGGASERVLNVVDPNQILEHVDVNALIQRIDLNELLDQVDLNQILDKIDIDALLSRADIDAIVARLDIQAIVQRAGIPEIVAESTGNLGASALDMLRRPLVGLDELISRGLNRLFRRDFSGSPRDYANFPQGPSALIDWVEGHEDKPSGVKTGRYAGPLTRFLAVVIDAFVVTIGFTLIAAGVVFLIGLIAPEYQLPDDQGLIYSLVFAFWVFLYLWVSLAVFGKTIGKMVLGLRVVTREGSPGLHKKEPLVRVLTYPLSFIVLGIGLLGIIFGRERQAWHDHFAGTAVVYDWGSRTAALPDAAGEVPGAAGVDGRPPAALEPSFTRSQS